MTIDRERPDVRLLGAALGVALAGALVAGCSTGPTPTATTPPSTSTASAASTPGSISPGHDDADIAFAQGMIPHHTQAVAMAREAPTRAASAEVRDLAARIEREQAPEIEQMTAMLAAWGRPGPPPGAGSGAMAGMMSEEQMGQLASAVGPAFDRMFLQMMIAHHQGAVVMAQAELAQGRNPEAQQLARAIIGAQQDEIAEMTQLSTRV